MNAQEQSVQRICDTAEIHKDIIYERLKHDMENLRSGKKNVVWHKECYTQYTHKKRIARKRRSCEGYAEEQDEADWVLLLHASHAANTLS